MKMTGPNPDEWDDGLLQPPSTPRWFIIVIFLAVLGCLIMGAIALT